MPTLPNHRLPKLEDAELPVSARESYEAAVKALSFWTDAYKLVNSDKQREARTKASEHFSRYIQEAIEDLQTVAHPAHDSSAVYRLRLLTYLDDQLNANQIQELVQLLSASWDGLYEDVKREAISFLCDSLYELQLHGRPDIQHLVFTLLGDLVTKNSEPPQISAHALRGLLVHASGLTAEDLASLETALRSLAWKRTLKRHSEAEPALARLHAEFASQYKVLTAFTKSESPKISPLGLPPIVAILSRKGGVGKTSLAIAPVSYTHLTLPTKRIV